MIKKILWATDGSKDSIEALKYAELLAKKCNADISGITVLAKDYEFFDTFSPEEQKKFKDSVIERFKLKGRNDLDEIKNELTQKGLDFSYKIEEGIAYEEIIKTGDYEEVDLIALGKGRSVEKFVLGGTVLKVLRNCTIPILTASEDGTRTGFNKILVPIDLSHGLTANYEYALKLSELFTSEVHLVHILETSEHIFPDELMEKIKSKSKMELGFILNKFNRKKNIQIHVEAARNAWIGITKLTKDHDIDLIIMMTYGGKDIKKEFIGSISWKVIQESSVPVITLTPQRTIIKMTGDVK